MTLQPRRRYLLAIAAGLLATAVPACTRPDRPPSRRAPNVVIVTIDTLRADHVGAYGYTRARTPTLDALASGGVLFERAYAAAPITLPSHATLMTGRYPPGHGARDNGLRVDPQVPTLAETFKARGFTTAAFVAAFPLDHQFGLNRGFDLYSDRVPRGRDGRIANERPASQVVEEAIAWLAQAATSPQSPASSPQPPFFLWVHLFDPHAPYGDPASGRPTIDRYDDEIAAADNAVGRLLAALGPARADTLVIATADHGEAFGEHGEFAHSIFVYDTTLRVPLIIAGPGVPAGVHVASGVSLADIAPTVTRLTGASMKAVDGIDVSPALQGAALPARELYAESFAPLYEFGWAPLRSIRSGAWKFIAAPQPELFDVRNDPGEQTNRVATDTGPARDLEARVNRYSAPSLPAAPFADREAAERLRALGYTAPSRDPNPQLATGNPQSAVRNPQSATGNPQSAVRNPQSAMTRPDPKDRRDVAARIAQVTAGELSGAALVTALEQIVKDDPGNSQAHLRLGFARLEGGDCSRAEREFAAAIAAGLPSVDGHLGLATCLGRRNDIGGAERVLAEARTREPDNPVVTANLGIVQAARGDDAAAIASLSAALAADPGLHEARFNLALAYARGGRRADAAAAARELLRRLPPGAPQRAEVERLLKAMQ